MNHIYVSHIMSGVAGYTWYNTVTVLRGIYGKIQPDHEGNLEGGAHMIFRGLRLSLSDIRNQIITHTLSISNMIYSELSFLGGQYFKGLIYILPCMLGLYFPVQTHLYWMYTGQYGPSSNGSIWACILGCPYLVKNASWELLFWNSLCLGASKLHS